jgi:hypothetical protein
VENECEIKSENESESEELLWVSLILQRFSEGLSEFTISFDGEKHIIDTIIP